MNRSLLSLFVLIGIATDSAFATGPELGDKAPLLQATGLLQAPAGTSLNLQSMHGKVVVLEFWATWCGPCVAAIAHLNQLADKFKSEPIQFIAITEEEEATVGPFLKKRPMKAWVALDTDKAMNRAYAIQGIPQTIILGKDGNVAAITHPEGLTEHTLTEVLAGRRISRTDGHNLGLTAGKDPAETGHVEPLFEVLVRPSSATNISSIGGGGRFTATGYTIWDLLPRAFDEYMQSSARIITNTSLPPGRFDFVVSQPKGSDADVCTLLQQALKSAFGLVGRKQMREMDVLLLKVQYQKALASALSPTPGGAARIGPGDIQATDFSLDSLAMALEKTLYRPVLNETEMTNHYDVSLKWPQENPSQTNQKALASVLQNQLGLELLPARRTVEIILMESAPKSGPQ